MRSHPCACSAWLACLALLLGSSWPVAYGQPAPSRYEAEVPVADTTEEERLRGLEAAFAAVARKVTGRTDLASTPSWPVLRGAAPNLVQQYTYRGGERGSSPGDESELRLWAQFDRDGVNRLLAREGLPVWGDDRPTTLLLVAVEDGGERFLLTEDRLPVALEQIRQARERLALPLLLPLMDLEDRSALQFADVWGNFDEALRAASRRYHPDAVLAARLFREDGERWVGQWTLHLDGNRETWETRGTLAEATAAALDELGDGLVSRYVPDPLAGTLDLALEVEGVASPRDYGRLIGYLEGLDAIESLALVGIRDRRLSLRVASHVSADSLRETFNFGEVLRPLRGADTPPPIRGGAPSTAAGEVVRARILP